jgi:hypothetical protein
MPQQQATTCTWTTCASTNAGVQDWRAGENGPLVEALPTVGAAEVLATANSVLSIRSVDVLASGGNSTPQPATAAIGRGPAIARLMGVHRLLGNFHHLVPSCP